MGFGLVEGALNPGSSCEPVRRCFFSASHGALRGFRDDVMFIVGLSGGIATGKSFVLELFRRSGFEVIDADALVHELLAPGGRAVEPVVSVFGNGILNESGGIDRAALGRMIFSAPENRMKLTDLIHPLVRAEMKTLVSALDRVGYSGVTVLDIPLLGDTLPKEGFDAVVVVTSSRKTQMDRLVNRRHMTSEEAAQRLEAQVPVERKERIADYLIRNDGSFEELEEAVASVSTALEKQAAQKIRGKTELPW